MSQKSTKRLEMERQLELVSGDKPWKQSDIALQSRVRYSRELANICEEEGDHKAVYSYLLDATNYCSELASRHPTERWQSIEAELQYFLATIAYKERSNMHDWTRRTSEHVARAKKLDPSRFKDLNIDDFSPGR